MTSPSSVITDAEARKIAEPYLEGNWPSIRAFVATGEIVSSLAREGRASSKTGPILGPLYAYFAFHGERGPQPDWQAGGGTDG